MTIRAAAARIGVWLLSTLRPHTYRSPRSALSPTQTLLLNALLQGGTLKSHRYLDGSKEYRLHPLNGETSLVAMQDVRPLEDRGLLLSNHKFPAATLFLSQCGRRAAGEALDAAGVSLSTKFPAGSSQ